MCIIDNKEFNFLEFLVLFSVIVSNIASVKLHLKITNTSILFDSFVNRYLKHLYYERSLQFSLKYAVMSLL